MGGVTLDDIDEIVEGDASVALVGLLVGGLQLAVLSFGQDAPLLVQQLLKVYSGFSLLL